MPPPTMATPQCPWAAQFSAVGPQLTRSDWAGEFSATTSSTNHAVFAEWATEFTSRPAEVSSWLDEFKTEEAAASLQEDQEMGMVAASLLDTLDLTDQKLANSKFVAFLRQLSGRSQPAYCPFGAGVQSQSDFEVWKQQYLQNIGHLTEDQASEEWRAMEKGWEKYQAEGYGYEQFAKNHFSHYVFTGDNELIGKSTSELMLLMNQAGPLKKRILACEAILHEDTQASDAWLQLGKLQQLNELDVQAIAALQKAKDLGAVDALIPLAASLTNESCIPEALDALDNWLLKQTGSYEIPSIRSPSRIAGLIREYSMSMQDLQDQVSGNVALSILFSIAGNHQEATNVLESALKINPQSLELLNRMGAVLANSQQYASALQHYDRAMMLENGKDCPRLFYNRAVSLMCSKYYVEAAKELLNAINAQLPARPPTAEEESSDRYYSIWDTLRTCIEASDLNSKGRILSACEAHDLNSVTALLSFK